MQEFTNGLGGQGIIHPVHEFRKKQQQASPSYKPGTSFDPKLADVTCRIIQTEQDHFHKWRRRKRKVLTMKSTPTQHKIFGQKVGGGEFLLIFLISRHLPQPHRSDDH